MKPAFAKTLFAAVATAGLLAVTAAPASAYTVCNRNGDCWHAASRFTVPKFALTFHTDKWWDANKKNKKYSWHDADNDHDWQHGYWDHGTWHTR